MRSARADNTGMGVERSQPAPVIKTEEVDLSRPVKWIDKPSVPDQVYKSDLSRVKKVHVEILKLWVSEDLQRYSDLLNASTLMNGAEYLVQEQKSYSKKHDGWQILVTIHTYEFKEILPEFSPKKN